MLVPLYAFVEGDVLGVLLLLQDHQTVLDLAAEAALATAVRVAPGQPLRVLVDGRALEGGLTLAQAGLRPLDRVDLARGELAPGEAARGHLASGEPAETTS